MEHHLPLTDEQWAKIEPLIPPPESAAGRGRPPIDERLVLDAILRKLKHPFFGCRPTNLGTICPLARGLSNFPPTRPATADTASGRAPGCSIKYSQPFSRTSLFGVALTSSAPYGTAPSNSSTVIVD